MEKYYLTDEENPEVVECSECGCVFRLFIYDECPRCEEQASEQPELTEPPTVDLSSDEMIMQMLQPGRLE